MRRSSSGQARAARTAFTQPIPVSPVPGQCRPCGHRVDLNQTGLNIKLLIYRPTLPETSTLRSGWSRGVSSIGTENRHKRYTPSFSGATRAEIRPFGPDSPSNSTYKPISASGRPLSGSKERPDRFTARSRLSGSHSEHRGRGHHPPLGNPGKRPSSPPRYRPDRGKIR